MTNDFSDFSSAIDLAENPDPRCPVVLVLDTSSSMAEIMPNQVESALDALNSGLDVLVSELNKDPLAKRRVEISFVTYGSSVTPATPFVTVDKIVLPTLIPSGATSMGGALEVALDAVEARKKEYKASGVDYYRPIIFNLTDGLPTDSTDEAARRIKEAEAAKRISLFSVGVEGADMERLGQFSDQREPLKLQGLKFDELFVWLSASQSAISASSTSDTVALPSPAGWAEF